MLTVHLHYNINFKEFAVCQPICEAHPLVYFSTKAASVHKRTDYDA